MNGIFARIRRSARRDKTNAVPPPTKETPFPSNPTLHTTNTDAYAIALPRRVTARCTHCSAPLPPFVSRAHHVIFSPDPEDLLELLARAKQDVPEAHIARLTPHHEYPKVPLREARALQRDLCLR